MDALWDLYIRNMTQKNIIETTMICDLQAHCKNYVFGKNFEKYSNFLRPSKIFGRHFDLDSLAWCDWQTSIWKKNGVNILKLFWAGHNEPLAWRNEDESKFCTQFGTRTGKKPTSEHQLCNTCKRKNMARQN